MVSARDLPRSLRLMGLVGLLYGCVVACGADVDDLDARLADFSLPEGYESVPDADRPSHHPDWSPYSFRVFTLPDGADGCDDVEEAFRAWADAQVDVYEDSRGCTFVSDEQDVKARANVDRGRTRVLVETYEIDEPWIRF